MNKFFLTILAILLLFSCSHKKQLIYLDNISKNSFKKIDLTTKNNIEVGDVLKIDINTILPEASVPYNNNLIKDNISQNLDILVINGYLVQKNFIINFPVLGEINVVGLTVEGLASKIRDLLINDGHLTNPHVKVKKVNSKFTVLGEVKNPGTFNFYDNQLNIFQALGLAGDLLITAKRKNIKILRFENGLRKTYEFSLTEKELFDKPFFYIKSNDVIIVDPNFSKIKSAGFIGSPSSIASISSLLLSITLLIINN